MELFAQPIASAMAAGLAPGGGLTTPHFEALRQSLGLPSKVIVDGALNFQIGCGMKVTAMSSDDNQCLLLVELIDASLISAHGWDRLLARLTPQLHDELACSLIVLDGFLSMVWMCSPEIETGQWVREAHQLMACCSSAREQMEMDGFMPLDGN